MSDEFHSAGYHTFGNEWLDTLNKILINVLATVDML